MIGRDQPEWWEVEVTHDGDNVGTYLVHAETDAEAKDKAKAYCSIDASAKPVDPPEGELADYEIEYDGVIP